MAELCLARGSAVRGEGTGGLCWRAVVFWALQEVVPILCKLRLGSACAVTSPSSVGVLGTCGSSPAANISVPGSPTGMGTSTAASGPLILSSPVASPPCPSCWAQPELLPARQEPSLLHPAPKCDLQHGQAGARRRYQGAGRVGRDPMTLSHDQGLR